MDDSPEDTQDMADMFQKGPGQHDQEQVTEQTSVTSTGFVANVPPPQKANNNILATTLLVPYFSPIDNLIGKGGKHEPQHEL